MFIIVTVLTLGVLHLASGTSESAQAKIVCAKNAVATLQSGTATEDERLSADAGHWGCEKWTEDYVTIITMPRGNNTASYPKDEEDEDRASAAMCLGQVIWAGDADASMEALSAALVGSIGSVRDESPLVRQAAAYALGDLVSKFPSFGSNAILALGAVFENVPLEDTVAYQAAESITRILQDMLPDKQAIRFNQKKGRKHIEKASENLTNWTGNAPNAKTAIAAARTAMSDFLKPESP